MTPMTMATASSSGMVRAGHKKALDENPKAAGIIFVTPNGRALFLKRSVNGDHASEWCHPGGGIEEGETAEEAAAREAEEECGIDCYYYVDDIEFDVLDSRISEEGVDFTTFVVMVDAEFIPTLNDEHDGWAWAPPS